MVIHRADLELPVSADMLVPHRPEMLLIDRLLEVEGDVGRVETTVEDGNPFLQEDGLLDPLTMLEFIAQSYAAVKGYDDLVNGRSIRPGYLVNIRGMQFSGSAGVDDRLLIFVSTVKRFGDFSVAAGEVNCGGRILARGGLKVWTPA